MPTIRVNSTLKVNNNKIAVTGRVPCELLLEEQKDILHIYFGISSTNMLSKNANRNNKSLYFGKKNNKTKYMNNTINFKKIDSFENYFNGGVDGNIQIYNLSNINGNTVDTNMIIYFPTGIALNPSEYYSTREIADVNSSAPLSFYTKYRDNLIELINFIIPHLRNNIYSKIILSGHSNGMSAATMFAYILYILTLPDEEIKLLPKEQNAEMFINPTPIANPNFKPNKPIPLLSPLPKCIDIKDKIKDKIYICGTAGFPCLFKNRKEFDKFNNFYKNKYIHIISGLKNLDGQIYDNIACENSPVKNFGSIIFNMYDKKLNCFKLDKILKEDKDKDLIIDEKFIDYDTYKFNIHSFDFYRNLYNKYFDRITKNDTKFKDYYKLSRTQKIKKWF